jgi:hypothetical protein
MKWWVYLRLAIFLIISLPLLGRSTIPPANPLEQVRSHTRGIEFDYVSWVFNAMSIKLTQLALGTVYYLPEEYHAEMKLDYLNLVRTILQYESQLRNIYADPNITDPEAASEPIQAELDVLYEQRQLMAPVAEAILQRQVAGVASEMDLAVAGQTFPPVLYHTTPLPLALVVSPRDAIRVDHNVSLRPGLSVVEQSSLEDQIHVKLNVSTLIVSIGGIGLYPTMVMETSDIVWLAEVVAHEWIHNYLTLRPLGMNYFSGPELQTMNETAASLAGQEIGMAVIAKHYPDYLPAQQSNEISSSPAELALPEEQQVFNFRSEMHATRIRVDELLADGKIEEAEAYMEERRQVFWNNGYRLRKLNQAYFAFYGSYADQPTGPAGEDPVGAAVRALRAQSPTLAQFLNQISWMTSFEQLQEAVAFQAGAQ